MLMTPDIVPDNSMTGKFPPTGRVTAFIETLFHRWQTRNQFERATCQAIFLELLLHLLWRQPGRRQTSERALNLACMTKDLLDREDQAGSPVQPLLESLGFSYPHLCRLFKKHYGLTPVSYRNAIRLERAKTFLRNPRMTIAEVAYAAGFQDPGYFARKFREQNGINPASFR